MPHAVNGDVRIAYEVEGDGPPLVLIHANPFDRRMWLYQVPQYAATFRTIAVDLRGYGGSDKPETPFTLRDMADDVVAVCRKENVERAAFMGASVGANIALAIGLDYPELVTSLVLVGGSARGTAVFADRIAGYLSGDVAGYQDAHIRALVSPAFAASPLGNWLLELFTSRAPALSGACIAQIFRALDAFELTPDERAALETRDFPKLWSLNVHPVLLFHLSAVLNPREWYLANVVPKIEGVPNKYYDFYGKPAERTG